MDDASTRLRDRACKLATSDSRQARAVANEIGDPFYRCQALAWVARYAAEEDFDHAIAEAFAAADQAEDAFRRVSVAAWPLRALVERGRVEQARQRLQSQMGRFDQVTPDSSRSEAIFLVFQAVFPAGQELWRPVLEQLVQVSATPVHWRTGRNCRNALLMIAEEAPELSLELVERLPEDRRRRQVGTQLQAGERLQPRAFFWRDSPPAAI